MRILPSYQSKGLGTLLLDWGLKKARQEGKGIFVLAGPETQEMFLINGFEVKADVRMNLADYGANGVFVESVMVWDRSM
jgi:GNAT superfamily N-acetyltransferase